MGKPTRCNGWAFSCAVRLARNGPSRHYAAPGHLRRCCAPPRTDPKGLDMAVALRWTLAAAIAVTLTAVPYFSFRCRYAHHKRLREVDAGRLYRSGQMTAEGFRDAVRRLGIKTVVNVQDEFPDPDLDRTYWDRRTVKE